MFNEGKQIKSMRVSVIKAVEELKKEGIGFYPSDGDLKNVIFSMGSKSIKISHHSFYRFSGIATITTSVGQSFIESTEVTNDMYMDLFMKPIIRKLLSV